MRNHNIPINPLMSESDIRKVMRYYKFYHIMKLTDNISTPGVPGYVPAQNLCMKYLRSLDLKGKRVLDIGCRDGLFSFAAESMGAAEVIGIDNDLSLPATEFLIPFFKSKIKIKKLNLYELHPNKMGLFDTVIFPGVLYHLRYPFWGIKAIRDVMKVGGNLLIETAIWRGERNNAMLFCPIGKESPYEHTSCTFFNEKGLVDTLKTMGFKTVSVEYLKRDGLYGLADRLWQYKGTIEDGIRTLSAAGNRPPIKNVTRCVFHSVFTGYKKGSFLTKYWESEHDFHSGHWG